MKFCLLIYNQDHPVLQDGTINFAGDYLYILVVTTLHTAQQRRNVFLSGGKEVIGKCEVVIVLDENWEPEIFFVLFNLESQPKICSSILS